MKTILLIALFVCGTGAAHAQDFIYINGTKESLTVWFRADGQPRYFSPTNIPPTGSVKSKFDNQFPGERWVALSFGGNRSEHLGWIDLLSTPVSNNNVREIVFDRVANPRTETVTYNVEKKVPEQITLSNGQTKTVYKSVYETLTKEVTHVVLDTRVRAKDGDKWIDLSFRKTDPQNQSK